VTIALYCSDQCLLPLDPSIALNDMPFNIGNKFQTRTQFISSAIRSICKCDRDHSLTKDGLEDP
jgi:hypothetical protein